MSANRTWLWISALSAALLWTGATDAWTQEGRRPGKNRPDKAPKEGEAAPPFTLKRLDGESEVSLEEFNGKQPVVLIFGSYT